MRLDLKLLIITLLSLLGAVSAQEQPIAKGEQAEFFEAPPNIRGTLAYHQGHGFVHDLIPFVAHDFPSTPQTKSERLLTSVGTDANEVDRIQFSPDGKHLLFYVELMASVGEYKLDMADLQSREPYASDRGPDWIQNWAWSPDSKFIALVQGSEGAVFGRQIGDNYNLRIWDATNGKIRPMKSGHPLPEGGLVWTPRETLLFCEETGDYKLPRPTIYEIPVAGGQPKVLLRDAWRPTLSPDGTWIAFWTKPVKPESEDWRHIHSRSSNGALAVARADGSERRILSGEQRDYPFVAWTPDNKRLITAKVSNSDETASLQVLEWNLESGAVRSVAHLVYRQGDKDGYYVNDVKIENNACTFLPPLGLSDDGSYLLIARKRFLPVEFPGKQAYVQTPTQVQCLKLSDGMLTTLANLPTDASPIAWCNEKKS